MCSHGDHRVLERHSRVVEVFNTRLGSSRSDPNVVFVLEFGQAVDDGDAITQQLATNNLGLPALDLVDAVQDLHNRTTS